MTEAIPLNKAAQELSIPTRTARYYATSRGYLADDAPADARIPVLEICGKRVVLREDIDRYIEWKRQQIGTPRKRGPKVKAA